ncbi:MAG: DNA methyltransferase [Candidatus Thorarchaeota archaeon]
MVVFDKDQIHRIIHDPGDTAYLTHNFHPYSAKFIPQLPAYFIRSLSSQNETILDPFCGSGTTLVEAKLLGRRSIGVDIHPLGAFMSRVKSTKIKSDKLSTAQPLLKRIKRRIDSAVKHQGESGHTYSIPDFKNRDHWFQPHVLQELSIIKSSILDEDLSPELRDFLLLGFSSIIVYVSNQESETRYSSYKKRIPPLHTSQTYRKKVSDMVRRMREFNQVASDCEAVSYNADVRELTFLEDNSVDAIVTSPPYPNTYDYYLYHKQRMNWLDMEWEFLKEVEIGSRLKHSSQGIGINSYLQDMQKGFEHFRRVLKPDRHLAIIIGDSVIQNELFRGDDMASSLSESVGFKILDHIDYDLGLASRSFNRAFRSTDKREHIVLLQNLK